MAISLINCRCITFALLSFLIIWFIYISCLYVHYYFLIYSCYVFLLPTFCFGQSPLSISEYRVYPCRERYASLFQNLAKFFKTVRQYSACIRSKCCRLNYQSADSPKNFHRKPITNPRNNYIFHHPTHAYYPLETVYCRFHFSTPFFFARREPEEHLFNGPILFCFTYFFRPERRNPFVERLHLFISRPRGTHCVFDLHTWRERIEIEIYLFPFRTGFLCVCMCVSSEECGVVRELREENCICNVFV